MNLRTPALGVCLLLLATSGALAEDYDEYPGQWVAGDATRPASMWVAVARGASECGVCRVQDSGHMYVGELCDQGGWVCAVFRDGAETRVQTYEALVSDSPPLGWSQPLDRDFHAESLYIKDSVYESGLGVCRIPADGGHVTGRLRTADDEEWKCFVTTGGAEQGHDSYEQLVPKPPPVDDVVCNLWGDATGSAPSSTSPSDARMGRLYKEVIQKAGVTARPALYAAEVPNAMALTRNGQRLILYNTSFMQRIAELQPQIPARDAMIDEAWKFILAHEVGHHVLGHVSLGTGSTHSTEYAADKYATQLLGCDALVRGMRPLAQALGNSPLTTSQSHPSTIERLESIYRDGSICDRVH